MCVSCPLELRPTKRANEYQYNKKKIQTHEPKENKLNPPADSPHHIFINLYPVVYIITADMTTQCVRVHVHVHT